MPNTPVLDDNKSVLERRKKLLKSLREKQLYMAGSAAVLVLFTVVNLLLITFSNSSLFIGTPFLIREFIPLILAVLWHYRLTYLEREKNDLILRILVVAGRGLFIFLWLSSFAGWGLTVLFDTFMPQAVDVGEEVNSYALFTEQFKLFIEAFFLLSLLRVEITFFSKRDDLYTDS